uniref:EF-hand domain-containing protein n=1 Tax=Alexandrium monilatum TaxID=311494 RepID=A0A7S4T520_9DINO
MPTSFSQHCWTSGLVCRQDFADVGELRHVLGRVEAISSELARLSDGQRRVEVVLRDIRNNMGSTEPFSCAMRVASEPLMAGKAQEDSPSRSSFMAERVEEKKNFSIARTVPVGDLTPIAISINEFGDGRRRSVDEEERRRCVDESGEGRQRGANEFGDWHRRTAIKSPTPRSSMCSSERQAGARKFKSSMRQTCADLSHIQGWKLRWKESETFGEGGSKDSSNHLCNLAAGSGFVEDSPPRLERIVRSPYFDHVVAGCIIVNAVLLGAQVQIMASEELQDPPLSLEAMQTALGFFFLAETMLRMFVFKRRFFRGQDSNWNIFDLVVVTFTLLEFILDQSFPVVDDTKTNGISMLRVIRILRIVRVARVIRVVRFFRELRMMVYSVMSSLQSLFWAIMLLFVILFVVGVYITQSVTSFRISSDPDDDLTLALEKYFGTLFGTMYYLLQSVTGGINWGEVTSPLLEIGWFYALFMSLFTCFTLFALLNIITGIFVEGAIQRAQNDKEAKIQDELEEETSKIQKLEEAFAEFDAEGTGFIELSAFETILSDPRVKAYFRSMGLHVSQAYHLFRLLDLDCSGTVNTSEFVMGCMRLQGGAKNVDVATLMYENKRMMLKWVTFMDFAEEQFNLLNDSVAMLRPDSAVPQSVEKKSTWREKLAKANLQNGSLNIYDQQEHNLLRSGTAGRACDEVP